MSAIKARLASTPLLIMTAILLLASCGNDYEKVDAFAPQYAYETSDFDSESDEYVQESEDLAYKTADYWLDSYYTTIQATDVIQITISHVLDELLSQFDNFVEFSQHGGSPREHGIAFITNVSVNNFRYIRINGAEIMFIVEADLFALDNLQPNTPLLVDWFAMGSMAYGGFAFDDENGVTRYFGFNYCAAGFTAFRWMEFDGDLTLGDEAYESE